MDQESKHSSLKIQAARGFYTKWLPINPAPPVTITDFFLLIYWAAKRLSRMTLKYLSSCKLFNKRFFLYA